MISGRSKISKYKYIITESISLIWIYLAKVYKLGNFPKIKPRENTAAYEPQIDVAIMIICSNRQTPKVPIKSTINPFVIYNVS